MLDVDVDVYRGEFPILRAEALDTTLAAITGLDPVTRAAEGRRYVDGVLSDVVEGWRETGIQLTKETQDRIKADVDTAWQNVDAAAADAHTAALVVTEQLLLNEAPVLSGSAAQAYARLGSRLAIANGRVEQLQEDVKRALLVAGGMETLAAQRLAARGRALQARLALRSIVASDDVEGRIVGTPIFDPRMGHLAVTKRGWRPFGRNEFNAFWGNAQFVVVREGLLVFHQKSLDFDPTPAIGAGTAVARLGLRIAAAVASGSTGVPLGAVIPSGEAAKAEAPPTPANDLLAEADAKKELLARRRAARRQLLVSLADLLDATAAAGDDATRNRLRKEFDSVVRLYQGTASTGGQTP